MTFPIKKRYVTVVWWKGSPLNKKDSNQFCDQWGRSTSGTITYWSIMYPLAETLTWYQKGMAMRDQALTCLEMSKSEIKKKTWIDDIIRNKGIKTETCDYIIRFILFKSLYLLPIFYKNCKKIFASIQTIFQNFLWQFHVLKLSFTNTEFPNIYWGIQSI